MRTTFAFFSALAATAAVLTTAACTENVVKVVPAPPAEEATPAEETTPEATVDAGPTVTPSSGLFLDLGEAPTGQDVSFTIPEGAIGFNIQVEGDVSDFDPRAPYGIERITDPSGKIIHDAFTPNGGTKETSTAAFDTIASASVPQGEGVAEKIPAGVWKVRYGVFNGDGFKPKLRGKVRVQSTADGAYHGGTLDLHLHVPPGLVLKERGQSFRVDAAKASTDTNIAKRVDTFFALASQLLGFERGQVVYHVAESKFAAIDGTQELLDGFAVSKDSKDGTQEMHMLLTNSISENGEPFALGIAPGIPGAATTYGRNVSGIVIGSGDSSDQDVLTMIHEMGHFIGLNHTTEFDGQSSDPLSDTAKCPSISGGQNMYSCPDRNNVMFPAGAIDSPVSLSNTQKRVYRGSPVYKAAQGTTQKTMALRAPVTLSAPSFHATRPLTALESQLSLGSCGLTRIDAASLVARFGRESALRELRATAADPGAAAFLRGRARLALRALGQQP